MAPRRMHDDELHTDASLVRRLLRGQFPEWAELPIERVPSAGTDNALYRLGEDLVVRMPRIHWAVGGVEKDTRWLPLLAPLLPVEIAVPLAKGAPAEGYPWEWGVYPWLEGENPAVGKPLVHDVARFVKALQAVDLPDGPAAFRGQPLTLQDEGARAALAELEGVIDTEAATTAWEEALRAPGWDGPPVWIHGDLMPGNLLVRDGTLTGVIDWGGAGVGDPAVDSMVAWNLFDAEARAIFRAELGVDDATWTRARGWALSTGLIALPYYVETNPVLAENARFRIREVLADYDGT
jgi:aminoglycoside phosphotransferase (APT) family kinase protein